MPYIRSASPNPEQLTGPSFDHGVSHGLDQRAQYNPVAFQITSPFNQRQLLLPHALVMHVNPRSLNYTFNKKTERIQTRGGFVEQHWGDDLSEISADGTTGAFMNIYSGLATFTRQQTIAWDRFRDLFDLYRHNGSVYDPYGNIVLQGMVMMIFDRGTFLGTFRSFEYEETDETPFSFNLSWSFKVEHVIYMIPRNQDVPPIRTPQFQQQNQTNISHAAASQMPEFRSPEQIKAQEWEEAVEKELQVMRDEQLARQAQQKAQGKVVSPPAPRTARTQAPSSPSSGPAAKPPQSVPVKTSPSVSAPVPAPTSVFSGTPDDVMSGSSQG